MVLRINIIYKPTSSMRNLAWLIGEIGPHLRAEARIAAPPGALHPFERLAGPAGPKQHPGMVELAAKIAARRRPLVVARRFGEIRRDDPAVLVEAADEVDRLGVAAGRGLAKPVERLRPVLGEAATER